MMIMTAKVQTKKILIGICAAAAVILALVLISGNHEQGPAQPTAAAASGNEERVEFLKALGWEVAPVPKESTQVRIPEKASELYKRYNVLQKSQGYDLTKYSGKSAMRYVYEVQNFPGASDPVYATVLVYKGEVIGGDITDTSPKGAIQSLRKTVKTDVQTVPTELPETSAPKTPA